MVRWPELTDTADARARLSKQTILKRATEFAKELTEQCYTLNRQKKELKARQQRLLRHLSLLKTDWNQKPSGQVQNNDVIKTESAAPVGSEKDAFVIIIDD